MEYKYAVKQIKFGMIFFVAIIILGIATLTITDISLFQKNYYYNIYFNNISGLIVGDSVREHGVEIGKVDSIQLKPGIVQVIVRLKKTIQFHEDYDIYIQETSIIGGNFIEILPGTKTILPPNTKICGRVIPNFSSVGQLAGENKGDVRTIVTNLTKITNTIKNGEGTLGNLLSKNELYEDLKASTEDIKEIISNIKEGKGSAGKFLADETFYNEVKDIVDKVRDGKGNLGKLISDEELYNNANETAKNLKSITEKIDRGDGTLSKLVNKPDLYDKATKTLDSAEKILGPAARVKTNLGISFNSFTKSKESITGIYLKLFPNEHRYFKLGASFRSIDKNSPYDFDNKIIKNDNDMFIQPDIELAWYLFDKDLTFRIGLIEGKPGGGLDLNLPNWIEDHPVTFSLIGRDAYNDRDDEDLDENLHGPLIRFNASMNLWYNININAGINRLFNDGEFYAGVSFEYTDEDIRTFVSLLGLGY